MIGSSRKTVKQLVAEANEDITTYSQEDVEKLAKRDDVTLVDIRDVRELERDGMLENAFHAPRGMIEFWVDPDSPYHKPIFAKDRTFIFYCASGWRSALTTKAAQDVGLLNCGHLDGGYLGWKKAGKPIVEKN